jgi:hypothetical protein
MSASNEAVNQAKEVRLNHPPPAPQPKRESLPAPTELNDSSNAGLSLPSFVYMALLITFLLLGIVFLRLVNRRMQVRAAAPPVTTTAVAAPVTEHPHQAPSAAPSSKTTTGPGTTVVVAPAAPPPLRLQAVFYSPTKPSAIVSGSSVGIGDKVREFHVTAIGKDSVTLTSPFETKVLKLQ